MIRELLWRPAAPHPPAWSSLQAMTSPTRSRASTASTDVAGLRGHHLMRLLRGRNLGVICEDAVRDGLLDPRRFVVAVLNAFRPKLGRRSVISC